jgi:hypothetical protein
VAARDADIDVMAGLREQVATLTRAQARALHADGDETSELKRRVAAMLAGLSPDSELGRAWERHQRTLRNLRRRRSLRLMRAGLVLGSVPAAFAVGLLVHGWLGPDPFGAVVGSGALPSDPSIGPIIFEPQFFVPFSVAFWAVCWLAVMSPQAQGWTEELLDLADAPVQVVLARHAVESILRNEITFLARDLHRVGLRPPTEDVVVIGRAVDIATRVVRDTERLPVDAIREVQSHLIRRGGAVLGVYGERGSGKSELIRGLCAPASAGDQPVVGVFVAAPTATDIDAFLRLVVTEACAAVPGFEAHDEWLTHRRIRRLVTAVLSLAVAGAGAVAWRSEGWPSVDRSTLGLAALAVGVVAFLLATRAMTMVRHVVGGVRDATRGRSWPLAVAIDQRATREAACREAVRLHHEVRHLETLTARREAGLGARGSTFTLGSERTSAALPLTSTDLVTRLRRLAATLHDAGYRIVIGIDELDRLEAGDQTDAFLNGIKQLFTTPHVSYLVSISDSAWTEFAQRDVNVRGVLDSSFDDIVEIQPLDHHCARGLIRRRGEERITDTQVLLCLALSGGLPRELLRQCRAMAAANSGAARTRLLAHVAEDMVRDEWRDHVKAATKVVLTWDSCPRRSDLLLALAALGDIRRAAGGLAAITIDQTWEHALVARRLLVELSALARLLVVVADVFGRYGQLAHRPPWISTVAAIGEIRRAIGEDASAGLVLLEQRFPLPSAS